MSCKIKFCGFKRAEDLVAASQLAIDYIGFNFAKGPRKISPDEAAALAPMVPEHAQSVALFVDNERAYMQECINAAQAQIIQLHGQENDEEIRYWQQQYTVIKAFRIRDAASLAAAQESAADMVLLDAYVEGIEGGTGAAWDYRILQDWSCDKPFILAGGLNQDNVAAAIQSCAPWAVDAASGVESAPAQKDLAKMRAFVAAVQGCRA